MIRLLKFAAGLLFSATLSHAQEVRASIAGIVTDPTGAPIAGATITVTSAATNATVVAQSTDSGNYLTSFLSPGTYRITVEQAGFKKFVAESITLATLDKARVDVQLQIGSISDSVTVTSVTPSIETETASRGTSISNELIANLPTQGRNPFQIAWAAPGVFKAGGWRYLRSFDIGGTTGFSVNGGRSSENVQGNLPRFLKLGLSLRW